MKVFMVPLCTLSEGVDGEEGAVEDWCEDRLPYHHFLQSAGYVGLRDCPRHDAEPHVQRRCRQEHAYAEHP